MSGGNGNYRSGFRRNDRMPAAPRATSAPAASSLETNGNPDLWRLLQSVRDRATGWTKTTRAMELPAGGVVVNTCTRGPAFASEALVHVPGVKLRRSSGGRTWELVATV